jgi:NUMOD3 motif
MLTELVMSYAEFLGGDLKAPLPEGSQYDPAEWLTIEPWNKGKKGWRTPEHTSRLLEVTDERRAKISEALKGNKRTLGHKHTAEARAKMAEAHKGNQSRLGILHTAEDKEKISAGLKRFYAVTPAKHKGVYGKKLQKLTLDKIKEIRQLSTEGVSTREIAQRYDVSMVTILNVKEYRKGYKHV